MGWMQFIPSSWKAYGVDANRDGKKDPYNPVDAIFAAARYLRAADADKDLRRAIFAYNHADWYVDSVLMRARLIGGLPADLVGSLSGLTQGHFPVHAKARYADDLSERDANRRVAKGTNAALPVDANTSRRGINVYAKPGSSVVAVQDGKVAKVGRSERLGRFVQLRDVYGNTYTYAHLKKTALKVAVPKERTQSKASIARELQLPKRDAKPTQAASAGSQITGAAKSSRSKAARTKAPAAPAAAVKVAKERLFANPARPGALKAGGRQQILDSESELPGNKTFKSYFSEVYGLKREDVVLKRLVPGRRVIAGTILGRIGTTSETVAPHMLFEVRPAGRGAPRIDPKPILDGWKLLESTAIYRAQGKNPFFGPDAKSASIGQILLMSKETLQQRVLRNPRIDLYTCGRRDVRAGIVDRRVLATLEFLAAGGMKPTVTSLRCGHGTYTTSGNVSHHSTGNAVDIAKINGVPILGNQGDGLDHRHRRPPPADAAGHAEARADHHADEVRRHRQHARHEGPRRSHPRRLPAAVRSQQHGRPADGGRPEAQPVDQADRPARRDRQPGRPPAAQQVRHQGPRSRAGQPRPPGRIAIARQFRFVQLEFPWLLGPEPGRYAIRERIGEDPGHVLVLKTLGAPERRVLKARRKVRDAEPEPPPEPVETSRTTLIDTDAFDGTEEAARWLAAADLEEVAHEAIVRLNRILHAHRAATADPYAYEVGREQAIALRIGHGEGEQVAEGRWAHARELARVSDRPRLRPGRSALRPQERLAALLGGRDAVLACEELTLRARADLDAERYREAALQLRVAFEAALAELEPWRERPHLPERLDELAGRREEVGAVANAALQGGLEPGQIEVVRSVLERVESALRARTATGLD